GAGGGARGAPRGAAADGLRGDRPADRRGHRPRPTHVRLPFHRVDRPALDAPPEAGPRRRGLPQEHRAGARSAAGPLEAPPAPAVAPAGHLAAVKRGLKRGLAGRPRTVLLMLDETIVTETPPLYSCYGHIGQQVRVPITGNRSKRVLHGAINVRTGGLALLITEEWTSETHQAFLTLVRSHWRGWDIVLFEDRASQH